MSSKRARDVPDAAAEPPSDSPSEQDEPAHKAPRADDAGAAAAPLVCYLPPTCCPPHGRPTPLASTRELEAHYARVHAHVCAAPGCAKVFPDARLLELHHTECHDPLAAMRKERGEKIFRCHVATCSKVCATAKTRRLHLIEAHHYPKQYFFAITNRGIGDLIARWGESASLLRPEWKPRPGQPHAQEAEMDDAQEPETAAAPPPPPAAQRRPQPQRANPPLQRQPPPHLGMQPQARPSSSSKDAFRAPRPDSSDDDMDQDKDASPSRRRTVRFADDDDDDDSGDNDDGANGKASLGDGLDALAQQLSNISFVPRAVQFGRGGAHRGFERRSASQAAAPAPASPPAEDGEDADAKKKTRRTNRGGRGRSRKKNRGREDAEGQAAMVVDAGDGGA